MVSPRSRPRPTRPSRRPPTRPRRRRRRPGTARACRRTAWTRSRPIASSRASRASSPTPRASPRTPARRRIRPSRRSRSRRVRHRSFFLPIMRNFSQHPRRSFFVRSQHQVAFFSMRTLERRGIRESRGCWEIFANGLDRQHSVSDGEKESIFTMNITVKMRFCLQTRAAY